MKKKSDNAVHQGKDRLKATCIHAKRIPEVIPVTKINAQLSEKEESPGFPSLITSCPKQWHNQQGVNCICGHILRRRTRCKEDSIELWTTLTALWKSVCKHTAIQSWVYCFSGTEEIKTREEITLMSVFYYNNAFGKPTECSLVTSIIHW